MTDIYIQACHSYLPNKRILVKDAVANELYDEDEARRDEYESIAVEEELWPIEMALKSVQDTLNQGASSRDDIDFLTYSFIHRQGHKHLWQPAAYLQDKLDLNHAMAVSVNHGCNSMMLSTKLAMDHLLASTSQSALVVCADRFANSGFDRWRSDYAVVYGDAAASMLLSKQPGPLKILHFQQQSVSNLESMHRFQRPEPESIESVASQYNTREAKKAYMSHYGKEGFINNMRVALCGMKQRLINETALSESVADWIVFPNVGKSILNGLYEPLFSDLATQNLWHVGKTIGHAGAADQFLGLATLIKSNKLKSGQKILMLGSGAGFSCSTLLLEVC